ncbi:hypothetical protein J4E91_006124 [Alternaria rosae]|nr:hypothetical protein J4E91_006124 [Alternaria rosae]
MSEDAETAIVHGRVFQRTSLDEGVYFAPVAFDDREESRLTAQHDIVSRLFGDGLFCPRIPVGEPEAILECGYGGGDWAVQCADEFEDCEVSDEPENLDLVVHNLNDPLRDPEIFKANHFDLIHSRFVFPGIKIRRWDTYIRDMRLLLRPGGWVQIMEYLPIIQSHNGRLTDQHAVRKWWQEYQSAMAGMDRDPRIGRRLKQLLLDNRYRDVDVDIVQLHIGDWSKKVAYVLTKRPSVQMIGDLLESLGLWPFTSKLGWTAARFEELMQDVRAELQDVGSNLYIEL